jgi:hypothetical protein
LKQPEGSSPAGKVKDGVVGTNPKVDWTYVDPTASTTAPPPVLPQATPPPPTIGVGLLPPVDDFGENLAAKRREADQRAAEKARADAEADARARAIVARFVHALLDAVKRKLAGELKQEIEDTLRKLMDGDGSFEVRDPSDVHLRDRLFDAGVAWWKAMRALAATGLERSAINAVLDVLRQMILASNDQGSVSSPPPGLDRAGKDAWYAEHADLNRRTKALIEEVRGLRKRLESLEPPPPKMLERENASRAEFVRLLGMLKRDLAYDKLSAAGTFALGLRDLVVGGVNGASFGLLGLKPSLPDSSAMSAGSILLSSIVFDTVLGAIGQFAKWAPRAVEGTLDVLRAGGARVRASVSGSPSIGGRLGSGGGFTLPGGGPVGSFKRSAQVTEELLATAKSPKFVERARALGYSDEAIRSLSSRIRGMKVGETLTGGWADAEKILIGRFGVISSREQRILHELGHVLDDVANPGLFAESTRAGFGYSGYLRAERVAFSMQYGPRTIRAAVMAPFTAFAEVHPVVAYGALATADVYLTYKVVRLIQRDSR